VADIELKVLRILHNYAFYEEPSRLIRATRLATRFHWTLEERTQARYDAAKENNYIENVNDRALGHEVEQLAHEDQPVDVLKALEKEGWLKVLAPHLSLSKVDASALTQVFKFKQQLQDVGLNPDVSPIVMYYLTRKLPEKDVKDVQKQIPNKGFVDRWRRLDDEAKDFAKRLMAKELNQPSATWKFLMQSRPEILLFTAMTVRSSAVETKIKNFLTKWPLLRQKLPFPEMAEMRITPELPEYRKIMDEAFLLLMDGKLRTHNEIVKFLTPYSPPEPPPPPPPPRRGRAKKESPAPATATAPAGQAAATAVAAGPKKRGRKPKNAAETVPAPVAAPAPSKAAAAAAAKPGPGPVKAPEAKPAPKPAAKSAPAKPGPAKPKPARAAGKPPAKKSAAKPAKKAPAKKSKKK
jgi:hypothetical protein